MDMSYQPVQGSSDTDRVKTVELGEDSETDVEGFSRTSEDTLLLGWKSMDLRRIRVRDLYRKACEANVPLVVSFHLLILNVILAVALLSQLWRGTRCESKAKHDSQFAPGELLWSQYSLHTFL